MLSDRPLTEDSDDKLGFEPYADALAELIDSLGTDTPLTVAISAPWGSGKTSLAMMVQRRLRDWPLQRGDRPHIVCWFNAWMHDDAPHLGAALAAEVARKASRHRPIFQRLLRPLPTALLSPRQRTRRRLALGLAVFILAMIVAYRLPGVFKPSKELSGQIRGEYGAVIATIVVAMWVMYGTLKLWGSIGETAASFIADPKAEASRGSMQQVHQQLGTLIGQATMQRPEPGKTRRRLVIFVDDLERCRPPRAVEVCEIASQLLSHPGVVTILIGDMRVITASADIKYRDLELRVGQGEYALSYGRRYLEKMVQIQFDLPISELTGMDRIISLAEEEKDKAKATAEDEKNQQAPIGRAQKLKDRRTLIARMTWQILGRLDGIQDRIAIPFFIFATAVAALVTVGYISVPGWLFYLAAGVSMIPALSRALAGRLRSYTQAIQRDIDDEISRSAHETDTSVAEVERRVATSRAAERAGPWLLRQRIRHYLIEESPLQDEAKREIRKNLPSLPRSTKRMYNHVHLVLSVAVGRGVLGGRLEARHLGKWIVFLERWPVLAQAVNVDTDLMERLESAEEPEVRRKLVEDCTPGVEESDELFSFVTSDPKLADVVDRLVHLSPVAGKATEGNQPTSPG
jgi:hypothetical protein